MPLVGFDTNHGLYTLAHLDVLCFNPILAGAEISTFGSIKTDIYYAPGWVCFAASSILRYGDHISTEPYAHDISFSKQTSG